MRNSIESEALITVPLSDSHTVDITESYQSTRTLKHVPNATLTGIRVALDTLLTTYLLGLESLAIAEFTQINPTHALDVWAGQATGNLITPIASPLVWLILVCGAAAFTTGWWLYDMIAASENAGAIATKKDVLPYPPLIVKVSWATVVMLMWWVVLGASVAMWMLWGGFSTITQGGGFLAQMALVLFFGIFSTFDRVLRVFRQMCDGCLRCSKSPCYDL